MTKPPSGRRPEGEGRADPGTPSRLDADEEPEKVAPWREWTPVTLGASRSGGDYPVRFNVSGLDDEQNTRYSELITRAAHTHFKIEEPPRGDEGPAAYLVDDGLLRVVDKELIVQFKPDVGWARGTAILEETGFRTVERSCFAENQWLVRPVRSEVAGRSLLAAADQFRGIEDVEFAWPNSVAEYRRSSGPIPEGQRWWLDKMGVNSPPGKRLLEHGDPGIVIAILDDGVDIDHPNLVSRVAVGLGRDFNFLPSAASYSNPRPKINEQTGDDSDYHGTSCAGLICSDGSQKGYLGAAPGCKLVAIRVFNGGDLISELGMVAKAIIYATGVADVISCSWGGPWHQGVSTAINNTKLGRGGKGSVLVCSTGNRGKLTSIDFPASHSRAIAIGACGPNDEVPGYLNRSPKLDVVAPSSLPPNATVYSTDVSQQGWGFNTGSRGDSAGLFATDVGKTSAATAMAAGVAALCLSANPNLTVAQLRRVLRTTAAKVGVKGGQSIDYHPAGPEGRSSDLGSGHIKAAAAVAEAEALLGP